MNLLTHNQALLRGILAGVVLSGIAACSRDRASAGRDTTQSATVTPSDSQTSASAIQPSAGAVTQPAGDTAVTPTSDTATATTAQAPTPRRRGTPSETDTTVKSGEASVSGYRGMERDTSVSTATPDTASAEMAGAAASPLDSAGVTSDYALTADTATARRATADTATAGYSEMARDTSSAAGQGDTAAVAVTDTNTQAGYDTANIQVKADTTTAQANADTTTAVPTDTLTVATADSADTTSAQSEQVAVQEANADTLQDNAGRIRPPEDSTEIMGNVTGDTTGTANDDVAANQSERIRPPEDSTEILGNVTSDEDRADVSSREAEADSVGAAAVGKTLTGIDAVAVMSRAGERCVVKDDSNEVWWDMADSPAALNPCGTGTMTLSLVRTGEK
jgi:hypothetical protein